MLPRGVVCSPLFPEAVLRPPISSSLFCGLPEEPGVHDPLTLLTAVPWVVGDPLRSPRAPQQGDRQAPRICPTGKHPEWKVTCNKRSSLELQESHSKEEHWARVWGHTNLCGAPHMFSSIQ